MTKAYLERMLEKFPLWLDKNSQLDEESIKEAQRYADIFVNYVAVGGKDLELKEL